MQAQRENPKSIVLVTSTEEAHLGRLQAEIEERKSLLADLEMTLTTRRRAVEAFEVRYLAAVGSLLTQLQRLQFQIEECYLRIDEIEEHGFRAVQWQQREDAYRTLYEKKMAEDFERYVRECLRRPPEPPALAPKERQEMKDLYRRLAKAFHPDLARTAQERDNCARLMAQINDAYACGDLARLRQIAEREQPGAADLLETPAQRIERLRCQRAALDQAIARLQRQIRRLENEEMAQLYRKAERAAACGRDFLAETAAQLQRRLRRKEQELRWAQQELEEITAHARWRRRPRRC
ncbi:MAG: hypothetical protein NZT92_06070 [Abditibacteriales bacterium]|nr:hypothetical protein [Abditibacteriales bacterium]MDW8365526.1 hypothetical protein [Abditibacteriales bacterium]